MLHVGTPNTDIGTSDNSVPGILSSTMQSKEPEGISHIIRRLQMQSAYS